MTDTRSIIQGLADDFWRRTWYDASPELMEVAFKTIKNPEYLVQLYSRYAMPDLRILPDSPIRYRFPARFFSNAAPKHAANGANTGTPFCRCWQHRT